VVVRERYWGMATSTRRMGGSRENRTDSIKELIRLPRHSEHWLGTMWRQALPRLRLSVG
jgi:hypothetical protein